MEEEEEEEEEKEGDVFRSELGRGRAQLAL